MVNFKILYPTGYVTEVLQPSGAAGLDQNFANFTVPLLSGGTSFDGGSGEVIVPSGGLRGRLEARFILGATGANRGVVFLSEGVGDYSPYLGIALNASNLPYVIGKNVSGATVFESKPSLDVASGGVVTPTVSAYLAYDPARWNAVAQTVSSTGIPTLLGPLSLPNYTTTWTVGTLGGEDFADLATALASGSVASGHRLLLSNQTFTISSTINVNKSVRIEGGGIGVTTLTTAGTGTDPVSILNVSVSNVVLKGFSIKQKKTTNTSIENAINISAGASSTGHFLDTVRVETMEIGVVVNSDGWQINGCQLAYVGPNNATRRLIIIYRSAGQGFFMNSTYASGQDGIITGNTRVIQVTTTTSPPTEVLGGYLRISGVTSADGLPIHQLMNVDYFAPAMAPLSLVIDNCTVNEQSAFLVFAQGASQPPLGQCAYIVMLNNSLSNVHGKGMVALNGSSGLGNPGSTAFYVSGVTLANTGLTFTSGVSGITGSYEPGKAMVVMVEWDSSRPFSDGSYARWYVNGGLMPASTWQTLATQPWVAFVSKALVKGAPSIGGLAVFNGLLQSAQIAGSLYAYFWCRWILK